MITQRFFAILLIVGILSFSACTGQNGEQSQQWTIGPFSKSDTVNPVMTPDSTSTFYCPVRKDAVHWESKDVFNPASERHLVPDLPGRGYGGQI